MIGPSPSTTGTVAVSPLCVACAGSDTRGRDERQSADYGPTYNTVGQQTGTCCNCNECICVCTVE